MYAEHGYMPRQSRSVSFGAAFLINGAIVAGMLFYLAPNVISKGPAEPIKIIDIRNPVEPPPIDLPKPRTDPRNAQMPQPVAPRPIIESESTNRMETTPIINPPVPPLPPVPDTGPTFVPETAPPPLPPLMAAAQDPRFAKDFQPAYPASELRAQRDGVVKIRVLIGMDGRVKAAEPVSATSDAFFEATRRQALSKWRFRPATRGGVPQESWKTMSVRFEIANQ
ncbi:TonB family protein [Sphingomonas sp. DG1-23]|uniref:energy transducer TonB n=1 Tax=Sphingomonas sp. DG1-23 TaxID=3068316 RepID=UPI00273D1BC0|nr:energy transducer TonB [Sphingomonas sp. DG1-23]MDP5280440.1 TonB family protein [Sphingomonas sp. DG1-23]